MRYAWAYGTAFFLAAAASGADKKLPIEQTSNEMVSISATALLDKDQIHQELGSDLGPDMIVVRVQFRPVSDKPVRINLDDFLLVSDKDGQRSQPFAPSQIAGSTTLVVTPQTAKQGRSNVRYWLGRLRNRARSEPGSAGRQQSRDHQVGQRRPAPGRPDREVSPGKRNHRRGLRAFVLPIDRQAQT